MTHDFICVVCTVPSKYNCGMKSGNLIKYAGIGFNIFFPFLCFFPFLFSIIHAFGILLLILLFAPLFMIIILWRWRWEWLVPGLNQFGYSCHHKIGSSLNNRQWQWVLEKNVFILSITHIVLSWQHNIIILTSVPNNCDGVREVATGSFKGFERLSQNLFNRWRHRYGWNCYIQRML